jgi:glycosyltransferase involved in cell wall biosynthesis
MTMSRVTPEEVRTMLNAADCLLVTSLHEGSPNIVKEAMACNLPVVSVPCGDVEERLVATSPGAVCPYDARKLGAAMHSVLAADRRSNGRDQLVAQQQSASDICRKLSLLYESIWLPAHAG